MRMMRQIRPQEEAPELRQNGAVGQTLSAGFLAAVVFWARRWRQMAASSVCVVLLTPIVRQLYRIMKIIMPSSPGK